MTESLTDIIRSAAAVQPVTFRWFMEQALYHLEHGYYASGKASIGRRGDFFTNVSVGPLFGRLLAWQFQEMWDRLDRPAPFTILEQGAHRGDFACDVLEAAEGGFGDALRYVIAEPFPALRKEQEARLRSFRNVSWCDSLDEVEPFTGVHFSNELLDAMPVHLVRFHEGEWRERYVNAALEFVDGPLSTAELRAHLAGVHPPEIEGYQTEINLEGLRWLEVLTSKIQRGYVLTVDYGYPRDVYFAPSRATGTLACHSGHQRSFDPLKNPGGIDITAHVDFTSLAERAEQLGWGIVGFTDQHHFIIGIGEEAFRQDPPDSKTLRAFQTLMHPGMLGTAFKILALARNVEPSANPLSGFQYARDPRRALAISLCTGSS